MECNISSSESYSCLSNLDMLKRHLGTFLAVAGYSCLSNLDMLK